MAEPALTVPGTPVVSAPGKVVLVGEYSVLDGGRAVVAAVGRRATGYFVPGSAPRSPLVIEAQRAAGQILGERARAIPVGAVTVESDVFVEDGRKLGLGSSAACTVVTVGAMVEMAGLSLTGLRSEIFAAADAAHRAAQGGVGSGVDVAASVYGGTLQFRRAANPRDRPTIMPLPLPSDLVLVVFSTGVPANTATLIRAVADLKKASPKTYADLIRTLSGAADHFVRACERGLAGSAEAAIDALGTAGDGLGALGRAVGVALVTPAFEAAAALAAGLDGAAKPSGAGGGDAGVALFRSAEQAANFRARLPSLGLTAIDAPLDPRGVERASFGAPTAAT